MFTTLSTFAHAGHAHDMNTMTLGETIDHCMPIIVGSGIIIVILLVVIAYLLVTWQPKPLQTAAKNRRNPDEIYQYLLIRTAYA